MLVPDINVDAKLLYFLDVDMTDGKQADRKLSPVSAEFRVMH